MKYYFCIYFLFFFKTVSFAQPCVLKFYFNVILDSTKTSLYVDETLIYENYLSKDSYQNRGNIDEVFLTKITDSTYFVSSKKYPTKRTQIQLKEIKEKPFLSNKIDQYQYVSIYVVFDGEMYHKIINVADGGHIFITKKFKGEEIKQFHKIPINAWD